MSKNNAKTTRRGKGASNCPKCGQFMSSKGHRCATKKPPVPKNLKVKNSSISPSGTKDASSSHSLSNATAAFSTARKRGASQNARIRVPSRVVRRKALNNLKKKYQEMHDEVVYAIRTPSGRAQVENRFKIAINWNE